MYQLLNSYILFAINPWLRNNQKMVLNCKQFRFVSIFKMKLQKQWGTYHSSSYLQIIPLEWISIICAIRTYELPCILDLLGTSTGYKYFWNCNSRILDFFATFYFTYVSTSKMNLRRIEAPRQSIGIDSVLSKTVIINNA